MHKSNNIIQNKWPENMSRVKYEDEQGVEKYPYLEKLPFVYLFWLLRLIFLFCFPLPCLSPSLSFFLSLSFCSSLLLTKNQKKITL